jgi:hypothetical protein
MHSARILVAAIALTGSACALAASQGTASGTSSTGNFLLTAQGPATPRTVQVLGLSDPTLTNTSRAEVDSSNPGVTTAFCIVDTYSGSVSLTVSTGSGSGQFQVVAGDGTRLQYLIRITDPTNATNYGGDVTTATSFTRPITSGTVNNSSNCGSGNYKAHIRLTQFMPETIPARTYTDTVTFVVTPQ